MSSSPLSPLLAAVLFVLPGSASLRAEMTAGSPGRDKVHPTRILARFADDAPQTVRDAALQTLGVGVRRQYGLVPGLVLLEMEKSPAKSQAVSGKPAPLSPDLMRRISALKATGLFRYVEPDFVVHTLLAPTDAAFADGRLWGLRNTGQAGGMPGADINAEAAWDVTTGSTNVLVAVIDTGIRYTHLDLAAQVWRNPGETGLDSLGRDKATNGVDDDGDGYVDNVHGINAITRTGDPMDDNDHGSHVSGTIGAAANNGQAHVGVAWNVRLMACKFLNGGGSGTLSDAIQCIDFAVAKGAKILNNSWGGGGYSQALFDSIVAARNAGVLFVAAAGNDSNDNDAQSSYPASYAVDNVVAVAAVDRNDNLAAFSNFGKTTVHLGAPGVAIFSSTSGSDTEYKLFNGTSMATPHVVGVAALLLARYPGATLSELKQRLVVGSVSIPSLQNKTISGGRLNAANSLNLAADGILEVSVFTPTGNGVLAGSTTPVFVKVTDLLDVNDATVTGTASTGATLTFRNDGLAPDSVAADAIYTASLAVPTNQSSITLSVEVSAPGKSSRTNTAVFVIEFPPVNDAFAARTGIDALTSTVYGSNRRATGEPGEDSLAHRQGGGGGKSVWWSWTAPSSGTVTFSTFGSTFDTVLAVYTGTSLASLADVGLNDDFSPTLGTWSQTTVQVTAGTTYAIVVDGFSGDTGDVVLGWSLNPPIANDDFADRSLITNVNTTVFASNFGAGKQVGEPDHAGQAGGSSVWWEFRSPVTGDVVISTAGSRTPNSVHPPSQNPEGQMDTLLAVYRGPTLPSLFAIASNDNAAPQHVFTSQVSIPAVAGLPYYIAVDGLLGEQGHIELTIVTRPVNDSFSSAYLLTGTFAETVGHNYGATMEPGEPDNAPGPPGSPRTSGGSSVWWKWKAPTNGNVTVTTAGADFDSTLGVYVGSQASSLQSIASNDDVDPGIIRYSVVTFRATAGTTYYFLVDGWNLNTYSSGASPLADSGTIPLSLTMDGASRISSPLRLLNGDNQFTLTGTPYRPYVMEASTDLQDWHAISTNTLTGKTLIFVDPTAEQFDWRFYRARPQSLIGGGR